MIVAQHTILFYDSGGADAADNAKAYVRRFSLTSDDVRIRALKDGSVHVITKREIKFERERNKYCSKDSP